MGNPEFCLPALEEIKKSESINLVLICAGPDRKAGRGQKTKSPATIQFAKKNNTKFVQSENINKSEEFIQFCDNTKIDLIIVFAFSNFLGSRILNLPRIGCFNIHTSLLPKYRGSSPIHFSLLNDDKETGVCIQKMVKNMDAGDILLSEKLRIDKNDNYQILSEKFKKIIPGLVKKFINIINSGKSFQYRVQNESEVTYAPLIKKEDGLLKPENDSFDIITNKIRAFSLWPGVFCYINSLRIKIHEIKRSQHLVSTGKLEIIDKSIIIGLRDESIEVLELQPPGKKPVKAADYINGLKEIKNLQLTTSMEIEV